MPDADRAPRWYALRTRSRHEKHVRDRLVALGIEQLLPTVIRLSQWKDRKKKIEAPLFSGYCFAHFPLENRLTVLKVPGVVQIVGRTQGPAPMSTISSRTSASPRRPRSKRALRDSWNGTGLSTMCNGKPVTLSRPVR